MTSSLGNAQVCHQQQCQHGLQGNHHKYHRPPEGRCGHLAALREGLWFVGRNLEKQVTYTAYMYIVYIFMKTLEPHTDVHQTYFFTLFSNMDTGCLQNIFKIFIENLDNIYNIFAQTLYRIVQQLLHLFSLCSLVFLILLLFNRCWGVFSIFACFSCFLLGYPGFLHLYHWWSMFFP